MTLQGWIAIAGGAFALGGLVIYHVSVSRELRVARHETSRFRLFAARSELVGLVASGRMRETDRAWRDAYETVNFLLDMHQRLHAFDLIFQYAKFLFRMDDRVKKRAEQLQKRAVVAEKAVPEFKTVRDEISAAFIDMVAKRTDATHVAQLYVLLALLKLSLTALRRGIIPAREFIKKARSTHLDLVSTAYLQIWRTAVSTP